MQTLQSVSWPIAAAPDAIYALARDASLPVRPPESAAPRAISAEAIDDWVQACARWQTIEAAPVTADHGDLAWIVTNVPGVLVEWPGTEPRRLLAIAGARNGTCRLLGPGGGNVLSVPLCQVLQALCPAIGDLAAIAVDRVLVEGFPRRSWRRARGNFREELSSGTQAHLWVIGLPPGGGFVTQLRRAGVANWLGAMILAYGAQYAFWILSWVIVGHAAFEGRVDRGWLVAWFLCLLSVVPLRAFVAWSQGLISISIGSLLKQRLLAGALKLTPEEVRHQGVGQFLANVIESEAVESLSLSGGFLAVFAVVELAVSIAILAVGAGGRPHALLLVGWLALVLLIGWQYYERRLGWTTTRVDLTNDMVERMLGHRTRLVQEPPERRHVEEDGQLEGSIEAARRMDASEVALRVVGGHGWLLAGIAGLGAAFVGGASNVALATGVGGVLLAHQALRKLVAGFTQLAGAAIGWRSTRPLFAAASRAENPSPPEMTDRAVAGAGAAILDAHDITYRYRQEGRAALMNCSVQVRDGDRLLLEGPSGGGKSTLAAVLAGIRSPESGVLLLDGFDPHLLGSEEWRRRVVLAPQFHENHLLSASLAFNLLMGRRWPPAHEDLRDAESICRELGLGSLLAKLPGGLFQLVGETGWQLSHGERSRVFIARALLQEPTVLILDESFGALDPESLRLAMQCVRKRARAVLVIAHP